MAFTQSLKSCPDYGQNSKKTMKNIKKIIAFLAIGLLACATTYAQTSAQTQYRFISLLTGYNVLAPTNAAVGYGSTNVLYTTTAGQIVYSLTNNSYNASGNTNLIAPDAFKVITLQPDVNGDVNANTSVFISINNTNLIPIAVTNSVGQWFIPSLPYTTNYATAAWATVWPLAPVAAPSWMYPATTNLYPTPLWAATNTVTVTLYKGISDVRGGIGPNGVTPYPLWETTGTFTFVVTPSGTVNTPLTLFTNLPTSWLQGAHKVYATVQTTTGASGTFGALINTLGIIAPQP